MATTLGTSGHAKSSGRDYDMSEWYDSRFYKFGLITMLLVAIFWVWYQRTYAYSHGMDSMEPEFEKVWMGLWRVHMIVMPLFALITWGWIWKTRDTDLDNLDPKLEVKRYFYWMMWLGVYLFGVYWGGSFFTEQDASWHQVIIRDTSFTPSHVVVFYGSFPMYIVCGIASYLYAMTRLPLYSRGTSFPLVMAIAGPLMILPNVGLNEWGHAFWFMEELFSAPLHWGFVILGWSGLFAGGIAAQIITRYSNLTDVVWNGQSKVILNNRIVPQSFLPVSRKADLSSKSGNNNKLGQRRTSNTATHIHVSDRRQLRGGCDEQNR